MHGNATLVALVLAAALAPAGAEARRAPRRPRSLVVLAGERVRVRWTDGDTFRILDGGHAGARARLVGVNALESYGPVHRWPGISPAALLETAKEAGAVAARGLWRCELSGPSDVYDRLLVACPEAAEALVARGLAMVFAVDAPAEASLLEAQRRAQAARLGMWAGGVPPLVPTSVHSADEAGLGPRGAYDRVADTRSGAAVARPHRRRYALCEEVCVGAGAERACMTYVPFARRYRGRPRCLR